jgi:tryptophan-rich sensory protein
MSGLATQAGINDWYPQLNQPPGTPPNSVFPIVWVILYTLMAFSLTLLWSSPSSNKKVPLLFFFLQLGLNFSWSWLFF